MVDNSGHRPPDHDAAPALHDNDPFRYTHGEGSDNVTFMRTITGLSELSTLVGQEIGTSDWVTVTQERVQLFADATGDQQWIHVDVERAKRGPFGGAIAHGFLSLSMIPLLMEPTIEITGLSMKLNYGLNKVRWPRPLLVGSRVRDRITLLSVTPGAKGAQVVMQHHVEIEGGDRPVCVAEWVTVMVD